MSLSCFASILETVLKRQVSMKAVANFGERIGLGTAGNTSKG